MYRGSLDHNPIHSIHGLRLQFRFSSIFMHQVMHRAKTDFAALHRYLVFRLILNVNGEPPNPTVNKAPTLALFLHRQIFRLLLSLSSPLFLASHRDHTPK